jgi:electron transport complex protein RnfA
MSFFGILLSFSFVGNIVFVQCLGWCPLVSPPKKPAAALGAGGAVAFAMTCAVLVSYIIEKLILVSPVLRGVRLMIFVLLVAGIVYLIEQGVRWLMPALHRTMGAYAPGVSANCAILGAVFLSLKSDFSLAAGVLAGFASGLGFALALLLLSVIRDKLERENVPQALRGAPIAFITAGLLALGFLALDVAFLRNIFG